MWLQLFNLAESAFWAALAGFVAWRFRHGARGDRRLALVTSGWLLAFSVSDVIEIRTGAWWRPAGLLALKASCVVALAVCGWLAFRRRGPRAIPPASGALREVPLPHETP